MSRLRLIPGRAASVPPIAETWTLTRRLFERRRHAIRRVVAEHVIPGYTDPQATVWDLDGPDNAVAIAAVHCGRRAIRVSCSCERHAAADVDRMCRAVLCRCVTSDASPRPDLVVAG